MGITQWRRVKCLNFDKIWELNSIANLMVNIFFVLLKTKYENLKNSGNLKKYEQTANATHKKKGNRGNTYKQIRP